MAMDNGIRPGAADSRRRLSLVDKGLQDLLFEGRENSIQAKQSRAATVQPGHC